jgi:hypothetical protein
VTGASTNNAKKARLTVSAIAGSNWGGWIICMNHNVARAISSLIVLAALLALATLTGCGGADFAYEKRLSGKYGLVAVDVLEQMSVSEMLPNGDAVGVINETVFAVGWDKQFVIVKQHPSGDKSITNHFILRASDGMLTRPLDEAAFGVERAKLGVPAALSFTLVSDSLK